MTPRYRIAKLSLLLPAAALLAACGSPGDPQPPQFVAPAAVTDLSARQQGDGVQLVFTPPRLSDEGDRLDAVPSLEIFRAFVAAGATPEAARRNLSLVYTVPAALVETYLDDDRVRFVDPLRPEDIAAQPGRRVLYMVRTRVSPRRASADSNAVMAAVYPVPQPVADCTARLTESAVELRWTAPQRTSAGAVIPPPASYRIFRAEMPLEEAARAAEYPDAARKGMALVGVSPLPEYHDAAIEFGRGYLYLVRSVVAAGAEAVESGDSNLVIVAARDTFPPAAPQNLTAAAVPATSEMAAHVELSWGISPEADVAGYRVYRLEVPRGAPVPGAAEIRARGAVIHRDLLLVPAIRDTSALLGRAYAYVVTAVDRAGNESAPSAPAAASPADAP